MLEEKPVEEKSEELKLEKPKKVVSKRVKKVAVAKVEPVKVQAPLKLYSFEQWAARRNKPVHHRRGLRAFVIKPQRKRTLEQWDACFKDY